MIFAKDKIKVTGKKGWLKKLGVIGFLFFLIKGLIWMGVALWAWWELKK